MTNRVLIGNVNGFKARITKPGVDVETATAINNFLLHEQYSAHNILMRTSVLLTSNMPELVPIPIPDPGFIPYTDIYDWFGTEANYNAGVAQTSGRGWPGSLNGARIRRGQLTLANLASGGAGYVHIADITIYNVRLR